MFHLHKLLSSVKLNTAIKMVQLKYFTEVFWIILHMVPILFFLEFPSKMWLHAFFLRSNIVLCILNLNGLAVGTKPSLRRILGGWGRSIAAQADFSSTHNCKFLTGKTWINKSVLKAFGLVGAYVIVFKLLLGAHLDYRKLHRRNEEAILPFSLLDVAEWLGSPGIELPHHSLHLPFFTMQGLVVCHGMLRESSASISGLLWNKRGLNNENSLLWHESPISFEPSHQHKPSILSPNINPPSSPPTPIDK